jgi:two-component system, NarL family, invasion response regulator UvrY
VTRILIADDHRLVRKGIAQIIEESPGMEVAGEAGDGQEALDFVRAKTLDVVILDIAMPVRGGLDVLREMKAAKPDLKIIVLSMYPEEQYAIRSLKDGASAYLTKGSAPEELIQAIRTVAAGKRYITPSVADRLATFVEGGAEHPLHEDLSNREMQVLVRIGCGKEVKEVAAELNLSVKTVSTYRSRILAKMGMSTNAQLIRYAIQHSLAP